MGGGDCYRYAARRLLDEPDGRLVFGMIDDLGRHQHAWFEDADGLCWDYQTHGRRLPGHRQVLGPASKVGIPRDDYYFSREASVVQVYAFKQASEAFLRSGYYGWWPDRFDNRQPLVSFDDSIGPDLRAQTLGVFDYARVEPDDG